MLFRLPVVLGLACLAMLPALSGCSSSQVRDKSYGTDAGLDFQIPDGATFSSQPADGSAIDVAPDAESEVSLSDVSPAIPDAPASQPADGNAIDVALDTGADVWPPDASALESGSDIDSPGIDS